MFVSRKNLNKNEPTIEIFVPNCINFVKTFLNALYLTINGITEIENNHHIF